MAEGVDVAVVVGVNVGVRLGVAFSGAEEGEIVWATSAVDVANDCGWPPSMRPVQAATEKIMKNPKK